MKYKFDHNLHKTVTVITPTIGSRELEKAIDSVSKQTYKNVRHLIVSDGPNYAHAIPTYSDEKIKVCISPENTGAMGYYGHRIYAAYPHLVNSDYIFFLDEDNWYEPTHVESLVEVLQRDDNKFAYSLRSIYNENGEYVCDDNCESLGKWPIRTSKDQFLIDTSAYAFRRDFLIICCHLWHFGWGGDRNFYNCVRDVTHDTNGEYTLSYRLGGNIDSVKPEFFLSGNEETFSIYKGKYPWIKKTL